MALSSVVREVCAQGGFQACVDAICKSKGQVADFQKIDKLSTPMNQAQTLTKNLAPAGRVFSRLFGANSGLFGDMSRLALDAKMAAANTVANGGGCRPPSKPIQVEVPSTVPAVAPSAAGAERRSYEAALTVGLVALSLVGVGGVAFTLLRHGRTILSLAQAGMALAKAAGPALPLSAAATSALLVMVPRHE